MTKALERQRSAAVRALGRDPKAEFRGARLTSGNKSVDIASPFLTLADNETPAVMRGLGDAVALLLRHTDRALHASLVPEDPLERVIFDMLEQLRCQALAPDLKGVRDNLAAASEAWCQNARANGVAESGVGLLVYTLTHMARARLRLGMTDEEIDSIIEMPRARLGRLIGHALKELPGHVDDQAAFAARFIGDRQAHHRAGRGQRVRRRHRRLSSLPDARAPGVARHGRRQRRRLDRHRHCSSSLSRTVSRRWRTSATTGSSPPNTTSSSTGASSTRSRSGAKPGRTSICSCRPNR